MARARQNDLAKVLKIAAKAGIAVRVEFTPGRMVISTGPDSKAVTLSPDDDLDHELTDFEARHGQG